MKAHLETLVTEAAGALAARNLAREYLQARILASLQRSGAMVALAFHGGTALRFLYAIGRYSEDLDFALERPEGGYDFEGWLRGLRSDLGREGYDVDLKVNARRVVHSAFVRFPGLPHALGFSPHPGELLAIKLEVDTRPPRGAGLETSVVRRHATLRLQHHDRPSLLAGKLHAILQRPFTKGRDYFDLLWYLSDRAWPPPNLDLLNSALTQTADRTGWTGEPLTESTWRKAVLERLDSVDWTVARRDVLPFLEEPGEAELLSLETFRGLLR